MARSGYLMSPSGSEVAPMGMWVGVCLGWVGGHPCPRGNAARFSADYPRVLQHFHVCRKMKLDLTVLKQSITIIRTAITRIDRWHSDRV